MKCFKIDWISSSTGNASKVFWPAFINLYPLKNDCAILFHVIKLAAIGSNEQFQNITIWREWKENRNLKIICTETTFGKPNPDLFFSLRDQLFYYYLFVYWQHVQTWIRACGRLLLWLLLYTSHGVLPVQAWLESQWRRILWSRGIRASAIAGNYIKWDIALFSH